MLDAITCDIAGSVCEWHNYYRANSFIAIIGKVEGDAETVDAINEERAKRRDYI
jgi:hypothetical protein